MARALLPWAINGKGKNREDKVSKMYKLNLIPFFRKCPVKNELIAFTQIDNSIALLKYIE